MSFLDDIAKQKLDEYTAFTRPVGAVPVEVNGKGGKIRHGGVFSPDNPHALQLQYATDNQDKDALYEKAINWEADRANLLEQREYDDPVAQMARRRAAGENPDLIGGSGSGSSSGSSAVQPQTQSTVPTSSKYQNLQNVFSGVQTASGFLSSISGFGEMVGKLHSTLSLLPSQKRISESEASVAEQTIDDKVAISHAASKGAKLQTLNSSLDFVGKLAGWVSPGTSLEDASAIYNAAGIDPKDHDTIHSQIGAFHNNPKMIADYEEAQLQAKQNASKNSVYSREVLDRINGYMAQSQELQSYADFLHSSIDKDISEILASSPYAQTTATNTIQSAENQSDQLAFNNEELGYRLKKLRYDVGAFARQVSWVAKLKNKVDAQLDSFDANWDSSNPKYQGFKEALEAQSMMLSLLGTHQFGQLKSIFTSNAMKNYLMRTSRLGEEAGMIGYDSLAELANVLFNDVCTNPGLTEDVVNTGLNLLTMGASEQFDQNSIKYQPQTQTRYNYNYYIKKP